MARSVAGPAMIIEMHGVGHLIHDSRTHRADYLGQLRRFLDRWAPA